MAYVAPASFRAGALTDYTRGLALTESEADSTQLTDAIARMSERVDLATNDHYEPENAATVELDGQGGQRLYLPRRVRAVTTVKTRDLAGTLTTEVATAYRVHSSLNAAGTEAEGYFDWVGVIPDQFLSSGKAYWPDGVQTVQVVGNFSWAACPTDIKRAVALLVWDHFKTQQSDLRWAQRWSTQDAQFERAITEPFGIPEADELVKQFLRPELLVV